MNCNQCAFLFINGIGCHETGCPNAAASDCCAEVYCDHSSDDCTSNSCSNCGARIRRAAETCLFISDARGIYIPRDFAKQINRESIASEFHADLDYLARGPDDIEATEDTPAHDASGYWDTWEDICNYAIVTDTYNGTKYRIHQDGDCWLIEDGAEYSERYEDSLGYWIAL